MASRLRFAYADPPYLGCCGRYGHRHEPGPWSRSRFWPGSYCWDDLGTHHELIAYLEDEFPDGWALSCNSPSLFSFADILPRDIRCGGWFKPFAIFKPNVGVAYAWEPILFRGGRPRTRQQPTVRDWVSANITLRKGLTGAKPPEVCQWILDILNYQEGDELIDLFPGTGVMGQVMAQGRLAV